MTSYETHEWIRFSEVNNSIGVLCMPFIGSHLPGGEKSPTELLVWTRVKGTAMVEWELRSESLHESFLTSRAPVKREQELHESWLDITTCLATLIKIWTIEFKVNKGLFIWSRLPGIQWSDVFWAIEISLTLWSNKTACYKLYEILCFRQKTNVVECY